MGELGVYPGHAPLLTNLAAGQVRLKSPEGQEQVFFVSGGILEVQPDIVTILADTAARAEDVDEAAAVEARDRARTALANQKTEMDYSHTLAELAQALAQIRAIQALRSKTK